MTGTWSLPVLAFAVSAVLTKFLCKRRSGFFAVIDVPNDRSLHETPTPRTGGLAILGGLVVAGTGLATLSPMPDGAAYTAAAAVPVVGASFADDKLSVAARYRLIAHLLAAALIVWGGFAPQELVIGHWEWLWPRSVATVFTVLFLAWMINLYNFMDGMDGFAAGMAVFGFGTFAYLGFLAESSSFLFVSLLTCAAAAGFLVFNFPPARIFMGDVGSSLLGLLAGALSLWAEQDGIFPLWVGVLVFSPFVVDATVTLARRALRRERLWEAHRTHFYQRVVQLGWGHRRTVLAEYLLMGACGLSAVAVVRHPTERLVWMVIAGWAVLYALLMFAVTAAQRRVASAGGKGGQ